MLSRWISATSARLPGMPKPLLLVMNPRRIERCVTAIEALPVVYMIGAVS